MLGLLMAKLMMAAIPLTGVVGETLRTRAFFDANNVKVGDPLVLTLDFIGTADFASLHPPALSKLVDRKDWKLDDASAKTETYRDARRLTYRVRPLHPGVLWFPELEFTYTDAQGGERRIRSNAIPVHVRPGVDIVVDDLPEHEVKMPQPDALMTDCGESAALDADGDFAWRKACAHPTADAFAAFDFPAAKFNEARCAILEGDWRRALSVYARLEWRVGQSPALERGLVAAIAVRDANPLAELPVWRQVCRPVLQYGWKGRVALVFGGGLAFALLFVLLGKLVRRLACLGLVAFLAATPASAQDVFDEIRQMHQEMSEMMSTFGGPGISAQSSVRRPRPEMRATVQMGRKNVQVGDEFDYILSLEVPKVLNLGQVSIEPTVKNGYNFIGPAQNLTDSAAANPSNVVKRFALRVRYDTPYKGNLGFRLTVPYQFANERRGGFFEPFIFSLRSERIATPLIPVEVKPLPTEGRPADFSGIVASTLVVDEIPDLRQVGTNDVVCITYRLRLDGYLPEDWNLPGAAFEWERENSTAEWRRFFVADGAAQTPRESISWYDTKARAYRRLYFGGTRLSYTGE